jgi:O-antigen ligase
MFAACTLTYSIIQRNVKIVIGLILLMISVFVILSPRFYLENTNLLRTVSTKERLGTSEKALQIFIKNPMGVGFDTYRYARQKYGETDASRFGPSHSGAGVDNSIIFVAVTTGILGLISYLYLLYSTFKLGLSKKNKYGLILVISLAGLIVNSLFINSLFYSFVMVWMWSLAGLTENSSRE